MMCFQADNWMNSQVSWTDEADEVELNYSD